MNGISVLIRMFIGAVISKITALYIGPQGMAILGNFRGFISSSQYMATLGMYNGVVKHVAELKDNKKKLFAFYSSLFVIAAIATIITSSTIYFGADSWNNYLFGSHHEFQLIFKFLALSLPSYVLNIFLLGILNGKAKYKTYILINILGNIGYFFVAMFLIIYFNLTGALLSLITTPFILLLATLSILVKNKVFELNSLRLKSISLNSCISLGMYSLMSLFSGLLLPQVFIQIRNHLTTQIGTKEAGIWEGLQQLSGQYMLFSTSIFTLYLLPKLSQIKGDSNFRNEIFSFYKIILPVSAFGMICLYMFRKHVILLLFSEEFIPMETLFFWQLIGDFLKITSLTIAYQLLAKKMFLKFIITESISIVFIYLSSLFFINHLGYEGVVVAHAISYLFYLIILLYIFRKPLGITKPLI